MSGATATVEELQRLWSLLSSDAPSFVALGQIFERSFSVNRRFPLAAAAVSLLAHRE